MELSASCAEHECSEVILRRKLSVMLKNLKEKKWALISTSQQTLCSDELIDYKDRDIDGIFDVTEERQLMKFVSLLKVKRANALSWFQNFLR